MSASTSDDDIACTDLGVVEYEARARVDRGRSGIRRAVWLLASMQLKRFELRLPITTGIYPDIQKNENHPASKARVSLGQGMGPTLTCRTCATWWLGSKEESSCDRLRPRAICM